MRRCWDYAVREEGMKKVLNIIYVCMKIDIEIFMPTIKSMQT
jgi:hypothetical protein